MPSSIRISQNAQQRLRCPRCHARLRQEAAHFVCTQASCATCFPIANGAPVLLNEPASVFSIADYAAPRVLVVGGSILGQGMEALLAAAATKPDSS